MSDTAKNGFLFNDARPDLLKRKIGDVMYGMEIEVKEGTEILHFLKDGERVAGETATKVESELLTGIKGAFRETLKRGDLKDTEIATLDKVLDKFGGHLGSRSNDALREVRATIASAKTANDALLAAVQTAEGGATTYNKLDAAVLKSIKEQMIKNEGFDGLLSIKASNVLAKESTGGPAMRKSVEATLKTVEELKSALTSESFTKEKITEIFAKGEADVVRFMDEDVVKKFSTGVRGKADSVDLAEIEQTVNRKASSLLEEAKVIRTDLLKIAEKDGSSPQVKKLGDRLKAIEAENPNYIKRLQVGLHEGLTDAQKEILKSAKGAEGLVESWSKAAGSNSASTTSKGRGFISTILYKNDEALGKVAAELKKPVSELSTWQKVHGGKAAAWLIGAGAIVAYLAGVGRNPDSGKYTSAENERRATPASQQLGA